MVDRLHPAVLERCGFEQCEGFVAALADDAFSFTPGGVGMPGPWEYETDDLTTTVEDVYPVEVSEGSGGDRRRIHLGLVDGEMTWFTDCGAPIA